MPGVDWEGTACKATPAAPTAEASNSTRARTRISEGAQRACMPWARYRIVRIERDSSALFWAKRFRAARIERAATGEGIVLGAGLGAQSADNWARQAPCFVFAARRGQRGSSRGDTPPLSTRITARDRGHREPATVGTGIVHCTGGRRSPAAALRLHRRRVRASTGSLIIPMTRDSGVISRPAMGSSDNGDAGQWGVQACSPDVGVVFAWDARQGADG